MFILMEMLLKFFQSFQITIKSTIIVHSTYQKWNTRFAFQERFARSMYQGQGQLITSRKYDGM